ncbi:hypothetical protein, partial [Petrotoga sp. 9PW.55.5.1]|uniref:hypothetical protein n=1 Tax=Petrotoga sp. 9PW.55.5.1 TaxID=1308979 RepID=UPI001314458A
GILFVMVIMAVSMLAASDSVTVPVYLNVPEFVRLSVAPGDDGQFNLAFDLLNPDASVQDTVALLAEANVAYIVTSSVTEVAGYGAWVDPNVFSVSIDNSVSGFGAAGSVTFNTTATINVLDNLNLGSVADGTKIADVTFTISSL